ncbi:MAG TPA: peptidylprolyl isomerase [Burkholderiales bacterium]|nr:peptidylprolyl isomerase [Burkholderiales bacterium]
MPRLLSISALTLAVTLLPAAALAQGKPAAKVNGVSIPQYRLDHATQSRTSQGQPDTPELRRSVRDTLINLELASQAAVREGLDKKPDVAARLELDRASVLTQAYWQEYLRKHPVTDDELRKEYDKLLPQLATKEYRARHILVNTEDEAKDIIKQLKGGGNFEKLAAEKSKDPGSKGRGGDLDWSPASRYVKPFGDALVTLKKGQTTDTPVKTDFGYHVIRLDDERIARLPTFEEAKPTLERNLQIQMSQKMIEDLRKKAKIE